MSFPATAPDQPLPNRRSATPSLPEIHEFLGCRTPQAWVEAALANQDIMLTVSYTHLTLPTTPYV